MWRGRKVLLCAVCVISAYLLLTPSTKLTISYEPLLHTGDIAPYGITFTYENLRPYPQFPLFFSSFRCRWVKIWDEKGEPVPNARCHYPYASADQPSTDWYYPMMPFGTLGMLIQSPVTAYLPPVPGTYTIQIKEGDAESNKLTISLTQQAIDDLKKTGWLKGS